MNWLCGYFVFRRQETERFIDLARSKVGKAPWTGGLRLLGIYHRQITVQRTSISLHFRALKNYPAAPKTLGECLRQKRVDLGLSQRKLAEMLDIGVTDTAIEKWEKNQNRPTESHRRCIFEFLGFDPGTPNLTGVI